MDKRLKIILLFIVATFILTSYVFGVYKCLEIKDYVETTCVVESLEKKAGIKGSTYYDVSYSYDFNNTQYKKQRSVYEEKKYNSYSPGSKEICYVNPKDPQKIIFGSPKSADRLILIFTPFLLVSLFFYGYGIVLYLRIKKTG